MDKINELTDRKNIFAANKGSRIAYFLVQANESVILINNLIDQYNLKNTTLEKELFLHKIEKEYNTLLNKFPASLMAHSADFLEQIQIKMFNEIQNERERLGLNSSHPENSLPNIIENMSPDKVARLMENLHKGSAFSQDEFNNLYSNADPEDEYDSFQEFLNSITQIKFLGGGNSKNFKITYPNGKSLVLKLEYRLDQPALLEEQLQSGILKDVITPTQVKRFGTYTYLGTFDIKPFPSHLNFEKNVLYVNVTPQAIDYIYLDTNNFQQKGSIDATHPLYTSLVGINNDNLKSYLSTILKITDDRGHTRPVNRTINRSLLVTDFCSGGDLQYHGGQQINTDTLINSALNIYAQMGTILTRLTQNNCAFPDMKNTNWLIDENEHVKIADTKSFIYINTNGNIDFGITGNEWSGIVQTPYISPPEMTVCHNHNDVYSADKMHVYMLGKNLYQYLTGCTCDYLEQNKLEFKAAVFNTDEGKQLKALIKSMVRTDPNNRISTAESLDSLKRIHESMVQKAEAIKEHELMLKIMADTKNECKSLLKEIAALQFGKHDLNMSGFLIQQQNRIKLAPDLTETINIHQYLTSLITMNENNGIHKLKDYLTSIRSSPAYYIDLSNKYRKIKDAILNVPVPERGLINKPDVTQSDAVKHVQRLLNLYCDSKWLKTFYVPKEQINAALVSKQYKEKLGSADRDEVAFNPMIKKSRGE